MKEEVVICDRCKRQLNEGEQHVTRYMSSSTYDTSVEDVCMGCVYIHTDNHTTVLDGDIRKIHSQVYWGRT